MLVNLTILSKTSLLLEFLEEKSQRGKDVP
jgi:hypothetical protein